MARGINKVILVRQYSAGDSIPTVAARNGVSKSTVRAAAVSAGVIRERSEAVRLAGAQGRLGSGQRGKSRVFSESHKEAMRAAAIGRGDRDAVGLSLKPNGYLEVTRGANKGRTLHRVIAEQTIGRALAPGEVVHHIDHNKTNNAPSNLQVMTRSLHTSIHRKGNT